MTSSEIRAAKLPNAQGEEADRVQFPGAVCYEGWVDAELPVAYFSSLSLEDKLYRCAIDAEKGKIGTIEAMDTQGMSISGQIACLGGGCAFYTPDLQVAYYAPGELTPITVTSLGEGIIWRDCFAAAGTGRTVITIRRGDENCVELWDLREGLCLGVIERTERMVMVGNLPNGHVLVREYDYSEQGMTIEREQQYRLTAPAPSQQTLDALYALCDRKWNDTAVVILQAPRFCKDWGAWGKSIQTTAASID